jgi:hypothetical protein
MKVLHSFGGGGITRGSYSLAEAMAETGYSRSQFLRARAALTQRWQRTARGGQYLITAEQLEEMAVWLAQDFWCRKHHLYKCADCASDARPHWSGGLCRPCYRRLSKHVGPGPLTKLIVVVLVAIILGEASTASQGDQMFLEQMKARLMGGRLPSLAELERAVSLCN